MSKELRNILIAAGLSLIFALIASYVDYDTNNDLQDVLAKNTQLEADIKAAVDKVQDPLTGIKPLQDQLRNLNENFNNYIKILPTAEVATEERLRKTVQSWCDQSQIDWSTLTVEKPKAAGNGFLDVGVQFTTTGSFDQFLKFLNLLERHEQFFKVNSFSLSPMGTPKVLADGKQIIELQINVSVSTFTYITTKK
jgi:Tfp pilus assembly protein PilO